MVKSNWLDSVKWSIVLLLYHNGYEYFREQIKTHLFMRLVPEFSE